MAKNNNLDSPVTVAQNKIAGSLAGTANKNVYFLFPCADSSPSGTGTLNTRPQSIKTNVLTK